MPLVSILMAAFRAEDTIATAVESVLAQSYGDWQLIIAADCGTDYLKICQDQGVADERLQIVATPELGSGPSAARNTALAAAGGDYVTILDSDDLWLPERLAELLPLAVESGLVCDNTCAVEPDGNVVGTAYSIDEVPFEIDAVTMMATGVPHFPLFQRELAGPGYRTQLRFAEDVVFNMELIARSGKMKILPKVLTHYVQRPNSATNRPDAWQQAEAAYGQIIAMLGTDELAVPAGQREQILSAFREKRRINRAYGEAVATGTANSFQAFLAARQIDAD